MNGAKEFLLVCVVFLVISCLTSAQPVSQQQQQKEQGTNVYDELGKKEQPEDVVQFHSESVEPESRPRQERSVKMPYLDKFMEKVNQKAIRSPSLRLRFGRRSDPDFPPNFDLLNEEFQQDPNNQQMMLPPMEYAAHNRLQEQQQMLQEPKHYLGFVREERKPARLRWGRSAPGSFSSAHDQVMEALTRAQRSKQMRLRFGRSGPMTWNNDFKDLSDGELASLAIQYLINNQEQFTEGDSHQNVDDESNAKN